MSSNILVESPSTEVRTEHHVQPDAEPRRRWVHRWWGPTVDIRGVEQLTVLLASQGRMGDYAGITDEATGAWAQVKRHGDRWWVEGRSPSEDWPGVFVPESWIEQAGCHSQFDDHATWSHSVAAELVWSFLDGRTIDGAIRLPAPGG